MELSLGEDKDFFASIYKAIPSDLSPKAQFDLYYERLITEADKLQKNYGIDNSVLDAIGANWRANINGLGLDVDFLKLSDEEKRYFKIQQQLNSLAPLYLNNENGITEESAGFWKSFNNGLRSWLYGDVAKARGHVSGTDVARQQEDVVFNQMGLTEKDLTTPLSLEDLKERQNVNWVSGEFAGQTIGTTAGILLEMSTPTPFKASALKLLRGTHALDGLKLTKLEKPLETIFAKAERNLLNTRFGKFTYEALNKGVQMEIAGTKHASASEELNFASGVAGAIGGALFSKLVPVSVTKNLISGIFGQNADKAISVLTAVGERIKSGVGEVGEETLQTLNQIYNQTLDSRGFWDEIENQFGTFDKVMQFVVSSFVMGGAMHTSVPQSTMDLYNQLDSEDKAKVDEAISAVREDFKRTESKMNEDIEQAVVEEQEKEELLNTDLNATESKESVEEQPAVEQLEATESTEVETPIEQTASESDIDLEQQVDETPISDEETVVDDSVESVDLDNALSEVESELDELSFDDISEQALAEQEKDFNESEIDDIISDIEQKEAIRIKEQAEKEKLEKRRENARNNFGKKMSTRVLKNIDRKGIASYEDYIKWLFLSNSIKIGDEILTQLYGQKHKRGIKERKINGERKIRRGIWESGNNTTIQELTDIVAESLEGATESSYKNAKASDGAIDLRNALESVIHNYVSKDILAEDLLPYIEIRDESELSYREREARKDELKSLEEESRFYNEPHETEHLYGEEREAWVREQEELKRQSELAQAKEHEDSQEVVEAKKETKKRASKKTSKSDAMEESTPTLEPEVKTESKEETPAKEEEVKVVLPPVAKGGTPRFMKFIDGEWKMLIDGEYDSVADFIQKEAQIKYESEKRYKKEDAEKREHKRLADKLIEKLDQAKIDTKGKTFSTIPLAPQVWNGLIEVAKGLIKAGDSIAVAMQKAVASISASQNLTQEQIDKLNQHVQDMIDSDKIFVSLIPDNVWEAIKRQTANNVNKGIAPALAIKKATNDILKGLVDKGVLTAKEARNIEKGVNTKARYATKEAKKNNTYNDSDSFNKQVLGIKSAAIQALEEMGNSTDKVYIDTKGKEARQIIYNYAKSALSFDALNSSEVDKILKSLVNAKTYNDIKKGFDAVDDIVTRQQMAEKQSLIQSIKDSLKHKNLTTKKGTRRVGKLSLSAQDDLIDYIDSIDINNLGNMDMEELQEIFENISDIISFGKMDQKAMDKVRDLRERKTRGTLFEALKKRNKDKEVEFKQTGDIEKDVDEFFSGSKKRALVIDGNIATTATTAKKLFKENPHLIDAEIKGYTTSSSDVQRRDWGFQTVRNVADNLNLFNATRNINSHLLLLGKGLGKEAQAIVDKLRVGMNDAKHNEREGKMNKLATMGDLKKSIFGSNAKADKALFAEVDKSINEDFANNTRMPLTAGHVLAYYAIGQQSQPQEIIDENGNVKVLDHYRDRLTNSGVDMDKVDAFMNAPENSDLKRYADEMIKLLNTDWRNDYEPTFIDLTNRPFSDDVYFPSASPNPESSFMNVEDVINKGSMNAMNATTGSLKERVGGQQVNTSQSFDEILIDYVDGMEHAKEYIPLAKQFNLIMSKENTPEIMKALGEKGFRQLVQAMGIEFTGDDGSSKNKWAEKAVSTWTYIQFLQTFALSLKQGVTQAVSAINLIGDGIKDGINPHTVLWNVIPKTEDEARFWMDMMTSNFIKERYLGTGLNPEMNRIISGGHKTHQKIHDFVVEVAASPMKLGDGASIVFGAIPLALSYYKQGLANGLSKEEAQDIAYRKFADSARRGLQTADSDVTTLEQKSPLAKVLLTFKSNQLQLANKAVDGYRTLTSRENLSEKEKSQAVWDILWYSSASAAFAAATSKAVVYMLSGLGDEVPEEEKEKVLKDIVVETVSSNIQGLGVKAVPVEWFVNSFFKGDDWKNNIALTRTLTSFVDGAKTGIKVVSGHGDKVTDSEKEKFFKTIGIGKGVDIYKNIGEYVEGDKHLIDVIYNFKDFDNKKNKKTEFEQLMSGYESEPKPFKSVGKSRGSQRGSQRGSSRGSQRGNGR